MAVLFAGNSLAGMISDNFANQLETTNSTFFDSAYVGAALGAYSPDGFSTKPLSSPISEGWVHFEMYFTGGAGNFDFSHISIRSGSNIIFSFLINNSVLSTLLGNGAVSLATFSYGIPVSQRIRCDIYFKIADSGGRFDMYVDGVLQVTFTGDTLHGGFTTMDNVRFIGGDDLNSVPTYFSQFIIADSDTRNLRVSAPGITGAGTTNTFTSGTFADVDEPGKADDTNYASSATANQIIGCALANLPAGKVPVAVAVNSRALTTAGAPANINLGLRSGGTDYFSSDKALDTSFGPFCEVWANDPNTSSPWTESGFNALEVLARSRT